MPDRPPPQQEHCLSHGLTNGRAGAKPERVCDYAWGSPTVCQRWIGAVAPTDRAPVWPYPVKGAVADSQDEHVMQGIAPWAGGASGLYQTCSRRFRGLRTVPWGGFSMGGDDALSGLRITCSMSTPKKRNCARLCKIWRIMRCKSPRQMLNYYHYHHHYCYYYYNCCEQKNKEFHQKRCNIISK